jgi:uncharacterized heparinase superfamily protein
VQINNYIHTVRYLKPIQFYGWLRFYLPRALAATRASVQVRPIIGAWRKNVKLASTDPGGPGSLACNDRDMSRALLWNSHYFNELNLSGASTLSEWHSDQISRWIERNPPVTGAGWESYPLSVRMVNWVKWVLTGERLSPCAVSSLAFQARHLSHHLEWRLMANHLLANAKALLFVGCFFSGKDAERWRHMGLRLLEREIPEQVLADGGHFERSPMYHITVLDDLLDLVNLANTYPDCVPKKSVQFWKETCTRMLDWLSVMCHPDSKISFFNDAWILARQPNALRDYAALFGIPLRGLRGKGLSHLQATGYVRLEMWETVVILDAGEIGPEYQPGHSHAELLSFELSHRGRRILVNSGTSTYADCTERQWQRSTAAHNTVEVDGVDQSEMWAVFRVARRARLLAFQLEEYANMMSVEGAHDGYRRLRHPVIHGRRLELRHGSLQITDTVEGEGRHEVAIRFHVHPDVVVEGSGSVFTLRADGEPITIELDPQLTCSLDNSTYSHHYGVSERNHTLLCKWSGACPISFTTHFRLP